jgi:hypothetical protein
MENPKLQKAVLPEGFHELKFTCADCKDADTCDFAFDPYNTNGDCLAMK